MQKPQYDIQDILRLLPHRFPMLMVDRILEVSEDFTKCRGLKNVTINEAFFQGHYPDRPIMPGVMIVETVAQVGAASILLKPELNGMVPLIGAIENAKFRRPVVPGDQLIIDCEIMWTRGTIGKMKGTATVDGDVVASMEMTFKLQPREDA
jgi:beta-hydroxyacyl-ACP dehydratase FabZ